MDHWTSQLRAREFPAGEIKLGGHNDDGKSSSEDNSMVVLEALPVKSPGGATAIENQRWLGCSRATLNDASGIFTTSTARIASIVFGSASTGWFSADQDSLRLFEGS